MPEKNICDICGEYDVLVAGGGLGGLTAANLLSSGGRKVILAEQHFELGGLAGYFRRKNHIFDVALHGFPIGMKKTLRKYWSKEMADRIIQVKSIRFDNPQFSIDTDFTKDDFTRILVEKFNIKRETVDAFYAELDAMNFYDRNNETNRDLFEKYFPRRNDVVRLLMEPISYANGSTLDEPAITYGIVFSNFMSKGVYTFLGGTDLMIKMMKDCLDKNGADYCVRARLEKILVSRGKVNGAIVNGKKIKCRAVLSNANLLSTILDFAGEENFSPGFIQQVKKVILNTSSCQVYIGLKKGESFDYIGDLLFTSEEPRYDSERLLSAEGRSRTFSVYYPDIRPGANDYTVVASMNARYGDWAPMSPDKYRTEKKRMEERTLVSLDKYIPGIREKIDHIESATPLTFKRYTMHGGGSSFGTKFEGLNISMKLHEQLSGLFHTGSAGIIMSGWLGAANYGVISANNVDKYLG
jgi:phytoene dehydrogenase-like protein